MADERWKLLEGEYGIKSQEDWDKRSDLGKEMLLKDKAFFDELHEDQHRKEADLYHDYLFWALKGRERYEYNFKHASEFADEEWNLKHNTEIMEQAKHDFTKDRKLRKKFGCWENVFFDRTLPEMVSMTAGVLNGLVFDALITDKKWHWAADDMGFKDWMNWFDRLFFSSIKPFNYWKENIFSADFKSEYYMNFYDNAKSYFSDFSVSNLLLSSVEPYKRTALIFSLWHRCYYYHAFILHNDMHDALDDFLKNEDLLKAGYSAYAFPSAEDGCNSFKEFDRIKNRTFFGRDGKNGVFLGFVFNENGFVNLYGIDCSDESSIQNRYTNRVMYQVTYGWLLYPTRILGSSAPVEKLAPYLQDNKERYMYVTPDGRPYYKKGGRKIYLDR